MWSIMRRTTPFPSGKSSTGSSAWGDGETGMKSPGRMSSGKTALSCGTKARVWAATMGTSMRFLSSTATTPIPLPKDCPKNGCTLETSFTAFCGARARTCRFSQPLTAIPPLGAQDGTSRCCSRSHSGKDGYSTPCSAMPWATLRRRPCSAWDLS